MTDKQSRFWMGILGGIVVLFMACVAITLAVGFIAGYKRALIREQEVYIGR